MPKSKPNRINHRRRILNLQQCPYHKAIYPGMIIQFRYASDKAWDKSPLVLVLWNDYEGYKIQGINLNYLNEFKIKNIFQQIMKNAKRSPIDDINLTEEDQDSKSGYDDNLPYRNLLKKPYTRLKLPTFKESKGGNPVSKGQAVVEMKLLYDRVLKRWVKREDMYRTYSYNKMKTMKVIQYDVEGLLR